MKHKKGKNCFCFYCRKFYYTEFEEPYLGLIPFLGGSFTLGEFPLRIPSHSPREAFTGLITDIVWPLSLKARGGNVDGSDLSSFSFCEKIEKHNYNHNNKAYKTIYHDNNTLSIVRFLPIGGFESIGRWLRSKLDKREYA